MIHLYIYVCLSDFIHVYKLQDENWNGTSQSEVSIAAIDNGLAFPFKHPDEWRACVYKDFSHTQNVEKMLYAFPSSDF